MEGQCTRNPILGTATAMIVDSRPWFVRRHGWLSSIAVLWVIGISLQAQDADHDGKRPSTLRFDVASIKPVDRANHQGSSWRMTPAGDLQAHSIPLIALITNAYNLQDFQINGCPRWVTDQMFDVAAKSAEAPPQKPDVVEFTSNLRSRLQSLLADRCHLVVRRDTTKKTGYALTVNAGGSKLHSAADLAGGYGLRPDGFQSEAMSMTELATMLSNNVHAFVVNQTKLPGKYKIDLHWSRTAQDSLTSDTPELPGALREQLGLRLVKRELTVEVLHVVAIQRPSEN